MKNLKQTAIVNMFIFFSILILAASSWAQAPGAGLPTANFGGNVQTTPGVGVGELTLPSATISQTNYLDGSSKSVNDVEESIIGKSVIITGAVRNGLGAATFDDATISITDGAFTYFSATLSNIDFINAGGQWLLNPNLDINNPATLNMSNMVLTTDAAHPSRYIDELQNAVAQGISGMKMALFIFMGDMSGFGQGIITEGVLDGVPAAPANNDPTAKAGVTFVQEQCLAAVCEVALDGSESSDPDSSPGTNDDIVSFKWYIDANNDGVFDPGELIATGETATVTLPQGFHDIVLVVEDSQGVTDDDVITVVVDSAELSFIEIDKAHVKRDGKVRIMGRLSLPAGVSHLDVNSVGSATIGISTLGSVIDEIVDFVEHSSGNKWKYKANPAFGLKQFRIDWKGAKFNYQNGPLTIISRHIGDNETSLEITSCEPVTIDINGTVITIDASDNVTCPHSSVKIDGDDDGDSDDSDSDGGHSNDDDDDCTAGVRLPFALTPDMTISISGTVTASVLVADYYTDAVGKFKIYGRFDASGIADFSALSPILDLSISLGDEGFGASIGIDETTWTKLKPKYWKFRKQ